MVERHFQCSVCKALFRNESGRNWHLAHRHELSQAMESLEKDYESRLGELAKGNASKSQEINSLITVVDVARTEAMRNAISFSEALKLNVELRDKMNKMQDEQRRLVLSLALRDSAIERDLGRPLPISLERLLEAIEKPNQQK